MSASITIYGASDDLIEVEGSIGEEFGAFGEEKGLLACSDGTLLDYEYDNEGCWRFRRLIAGSARFEHTPACGPGAPDHVDGKPGYSDVVTLTGDVKWVAHAKRWAR